MQSYILTFYKYLTSKITLMLLYFESFEHEVLIFETSTADVMEITPMMIGTSPSLLCKDWTLTVPDSRLLLVRLLDVAQAVNVAFLWILAQKGSNDNK